MSTVCPPPVSPQISSCERSGWQNSAPGGLTNEERLCWRALCEADPEAGIETLPELVSLREDARLLYRGDEEHRWQSLAILMPETFPIRRHVLPGSRDRLTGFRLAGHRIVTGDHATWTEPTIAAVAEELFSTGGELMELEDVPHGSELWDALQGLTGRGFHLGTPLPPQPHYRLVLPESADAYWSGFSSKTRSQMRRRRRKLDAKLLRYTEPDQVDEFLKLGHAVSKKTWQYLSNGLLLPNHEESRRRRWMLAELGLWRAYLLCSGDEPVAYVDGHQSQGSYLYQQPGFDQSYAKFGPGRVLITCLIDDLYEHDPPRVLDFGPGFMPYKAEFGNQHSTTATVWLLPPGTASWRTVQSLRWKQRLHSGAKRVLTKTGLVSRARSLVRRRRSGSTGGE